MEQTRELGLRVLMGLLLAGSAAWAAEAPAGLLQGFSEASHRSDELMRGATMDVDINASMPKLGGSATLQGLRKVSRLGRVTYDKLRLSGDAQVKRQVIARYLNAETGEGAESAPRAVPLTLENYKFKYKGEQRIDGVDARVFRVTPKHKQTGAFQGEIWIDAATHLPVRESGKVLAGSLFLKKINVVRDFHRAGGVAFPDHTLVTIDTRLAGRAELTVDYRNLMLDRDDAAGTSAFIADAPAVQ